MRITRRAAVTVALMLALVGCGPPATPTTPTPTIEPTVAMNPPPAPGPTPGPTPQPGGSQLVVTVVTVPFRPGVPGQISYSVAGTEPLARLGVSVSSGGAVARSETSPASPSGTLTMSLASGTYRVTVSATTRSGMTLEETVTLDVES